MSAQTDGKLRIGLVLDDPKVSRRVFEFVQWAQAHERLKVVQIIVAPPARQGGAVANALLDLARAAEQLLLLKNAHYRDDFELRDVSALAPTAAAGDLDLIVALSCRDLDAMPEARLGAICLDCGDEDSSIAGFWDSYLRNDTTAFAVRHRRGGDVTTLFCGRVGTQFYFLLNRAALLDQSLYYLRTLVGKTALTGALPPALDGGLADKPRGFPGAAQMLGYLAKLACRVGVKLWRSALSLDYQWSMAFVRAPWRDAAFERATVVKNPPGRWLADPFVISRDGKTYCFAEDYHLDDHRGRISVWELRDGGAVFVGDTLDESFHLSFPYLFEHGGALFMCPETSANRTIQIYRCVEFPLRWALEKVIMRDVTAVDTMLFERDGKWWMFTNIDPAGFVAFPELSIFSADSPFAEHWTPHPQNPVLVDASRSRNGGLVRDGAGLFRVAQAQGFDFYGKSTIVNEITALDERAYAERTVRAVTPAFRPGVHGTHHLHSDGATTVIDLARLVRG